MSTPYRFTPPIRAPHPAPLSASQYLTRNQRLPRAPVINPYDVFTQPEFDAWIGGITGALKRALGEEDEPPKSQVFQKSQQPGKTSIFAEETDEDENVHDLFAEIKERRIINKGKARDPREGPGFGKGDSSQPIEIVSSDEEEEEEVHAAIADNVSYDEEQEGTEDFEDEQSEEDNVSWQYGQSSAQILPPPKKNEKRMEILSDDEYDEAEEGYGSEEFDEMKSDEVVEYIDDSDIEEEGPGKAQKSGRDTSLVISLVSDEEGDKKEKWPGRDPSFAQVLNWGKEGISRPPNEELVDLEREYDGSESEPSEDEDKENQSPIFPLNSLSTPLIRRPRDQRSDNKDDTEEQQALDSDSEIEEIQPFNQDTSFPSLSQRDDKNPIEIPDPWLGPRIYAQDFYSGGDVHILPGVKADPNHIGLADSEGRLLDSEENGTNIDLIQLEDDTSFPHPEQDENTSPVDIADPWKGVQTYAEDLYSSGEVMPPLDKNVDAHNLGLQMFQSDGGLDLEDAESQPQTEPPAKFPLPYAEDFYSGDVHTIAGHRLAPDRLAGTGGGDDNSVIPEMSFPNPNVAGAFSDDTHEQDFAIQPPYSAPSMSESHRMPLEDSIFNVDHFVGDQEQPSSPREIHTPEVQVQEGSGYSASAVQHEKHKVPEIFLPSTQDTLKEAHEASKFLYDDLVPHFENAKVFEQEVDVLKRHGAEDQMDDIAALSGTILDESFLLENATVQHDHAIEQSSPENQDNAQEPSLPDVGVETFAVLSIAEPIRDDVIAENEATFVLEESEFTSGEISAMNTPTEIVTLLQENGANFNVELEAVEMYENDIRSPGFEFQNIPSPPGAGVEPSALSLSSDSGDVTSLLRDEIFSTPAPNELSLEGGQITNVVQPILRDESEWESGTHIQEPIDVLISDDDADGEIDWEIMSSDSRNYIGIIGGAVEYSVEEITTEGRLTEEPERDMSIEVASIGVSEMGSSRELVDEEVHSSPASRMEATKGLSGETGSITLFDETESSNTDVLEAPESSIDDNTPIHVPFILPTDQTELFPSVPQTLSVSSPTKVNEPVDLPNSSVTRSSTESLEVIHCRILDSLAAIFVCEGVEIQEERTQTSDSPPPILPNVGNKNGTPEPTLTKDNSFQSSQAVTEPEAIVSQPQNHSPTRESWSESRVVLNVPLRRKSTDPMLMPDPYPYSLSTPRNNDTRELYSSPIFDTNSLGIKLDYKSRSPSGELDSFELQYPSENDVPKVRKQTVALTSGTEVFDVAVSTEPPSMQVRDESSTAADLKNENSSAKRKRSSSPVPTPTAQWSSKGLSKGKGKNRKGPKTDRKGSKVTTFEPTSNETILVRRPKPPVLDEKGDDSGTFTPITQPAEPSNPTTFPTASRSSSLTSPIADDKLPSAPSTSLDRQQTNVSLPQPFVHAHGQKRKQANQNVPQNLLQQVQIQKRQLPRIVPPFHPIDAVTITTPVSASAHPPLPSPIAVASSPSAVPPVDAPASPTIRSPKVPPKPSPSRQNPTPSSTAVVTRSHCRYRRVSLPKEEGGPRVYFLVPGCSLNDKELMEEEDIEDHGDASHEDSLRMIKDIESLGFHLDLIGIIRQLVGLDILREQEVFYLPRAGEEVVRRNSTRKSLNERSPLYKASGESYYNFSVSPGHSGSIRSPASLKAPHSIADSTSTSRSAFRRIIDSSEIGSTISPTDSEPESSNDEEPSSKRQKSSPAEDKRAMAPPATQSIGKKMARNGRSTRQKKQDPTYQPNKNEVSDGEVRRSTKRRTKSSRGIKRSRVTDTLPDQDENERDPKKLRTQATINTEKPA